MITSSETFEIERMPTLDMRDVLICAVRRGRLTRQRKQFSETQVGTIEKAWKDKRDWYAVLSCARMHFEGHI
jgi:hypothetical protein